MTESFSKTFLSAQTHLIYLQKQLRGGEQKSKCNDNFFLPDFFFKYGNAVTEILQLSTQIDVTHLNKPPSNDIKLQELINSIESACETLVSVFHSLPEELGRHFNLDIFKITKAILTSLVHFIHSLSVKKSVSGRDCLKYAENVFLKCEYFHKIPKNNLDSVLRLLHREELLLLDALQEIDEEVKSNFYGLKYGEDIDNTETWNNQDKKLLFPCVALVKTAHLCLKKVTSAIKANGNCTTNENIKQLDEIAFTVEDMTQAVNNFVAAFYPPMNRKDVRRDAFKVVNLIQDLLKQAQNSHFALEEDQTWINGFKSIDHNNNKLHPLFSEEHFYEINETDYSDEDY